MFSNSFHSISSPNVMKTVESNNYIHMTSAVTNISLTIMEEGIMYLFIYFISFPYIPFRYMPWKWTM